jgi:hypothetical protein
MLSMLPILLILPMLPILLLLPMLPILLLLPMLPILQDGRNVILAVWNAIESLQSRIIDHDCVAIECDALMWQCKNKCNIMYNVTR